MFQLGLRGEDAQGMIESQEFSLMDRAEAVQKEAAGRLGRPPRGPARKCPADLQCGAGLTANAHALMGTKAVSLGLPPC